MIILSILLKKSSKYATFAKIFEELKRWNKKLLRYFFLLLFLGYYGSITLFTHSHVVQGSVIVHSHLYNPFSKEKHSNQQHSTNELILINLCSQFFVTVAFAALVLGLVKVVLKQYTFRRNETHFFSPICLRLNGLRAPPLNIHN